MPNLIDLGLLTLSQIESFSKSYATEDEKRLDVFKEIPFQNLTSDEIKDLNFKLPNTPRSNVNELPFQNLTSDEIKDLNFKLPNTPRSKVNELPFQNLTSDEIKDLNFKLPDKVAPEIDKLRGTLKQVNTNQSNNQFIQAIELQDSVSNGPEITEGSIVAAHDGVNAEPSVDAEPYKVNELPFQNLTSDEIKDLNFKLPNTPRSKVNELPFQNLTSDEIKDLNFKLPDKVAPEIDKLRGTLKQVNTNQSNNQFIQAIELQDSVSNGPEITEGSIVAAHDGVNAEPSVDAEPYKVNELPFQNLTSDEIKDLNFKLPDKVAPEINKLREYRNMQTARVDEAFKKIQEDWDRERAGQAEVLVKTAQERDVALVQLGEMSEKIKEKEERPDVFKEIPFQNLTSDEIKDLNFKLPNTPRSNVNPDDVLPDLTINPLIKVIEGQAPVSNAPEITESSVVAAPDGVNAEHYMDVEMTQAKIDKMIEDDVLPDLTILPSEIDFLKHSTMRNEFIEASKKFLDITTKKIDIERRPSKFLEFSKISPPEKDNLLTARLDILIGKLKEKIKNSITLREKRMQELQVDLKKFEKSHTDFETVHNKYVISPVNLKNPSEEKDHAANFATLETTNKELVDTSNSIREQWKPIHDERESIEKNIDIFNKLNAERASLINFQKKGLDLNGIDPENCFTNNEIAEKILKKLMPRFDYKEVLEKLVGELELGPYSMLTEEQLKLPHMEILDVLNFLKESGAYQGIIHQTENEVAQEKAFQELTGKKYAEDTGKKKFAHIFSEKLEKLIKGQLHIMELAYKIKSTNDEKQWKALFRELKKVCKDDKGAYNRPTFREICKKNGIDSQRKELRRLVRFTKFIKKQVSGQGILQSGGLHVDDDKNVSIPTPLVSSSGIKDEQTDIEVTTPIFTHSLSNRSSIPSQNAPPPPRQNAEIATPIYEEVPPLMESGSTHKQEPSPVSTRTYRGQNSNLSSFFPANNRSTAIKGTHSEANNSINESGNAQLTVATIQAA